jgi:hypothetical protein
MKLIYGKRASTPKPPANLSVNWSAGKLRLWVPVIHS